MIEGLPDQQKEPIHDFLTSYYNQTKRSTISLKSFINNIAKAYQQGKFNLSKVVKYNEQIDEKKLKEIIEQSIEQPSLKQQIQARKEELKAKESFSPASHRAQPNSSYYKGRPQTKLSVYLITRPEAKNLMSSQH
jgi:hypothetical protein